MDHLVAPRVAYDIELLLAQDQSEAEETKGLSGVVPRKLRRSLPMGTQLWS